MNASDFRTHKDALRAIYANCLRSRRLDEELQRLYHARQGVRVCFGAVGNEVGASVIASLLGPEDILVPRYRGYAAVLAKGMPMALITGEMFGKRTGSAKGTGDVSAFKDWEHNICGHSATLGANFSITVGLAFALKYRHKPGIVVQLFGDGESSRNSFAGALNLASLWNLPILFVCENNGVSIDVPAAQMSATPTIAERAKGYAIPADMAREIEPLTLFEHARTAISRVRQDHAPFLFEIVEKRFTSHSSNYDSKPLTGAMIPEAEDPLATLKAALLGLGATNAELEILVLHAEKEVAAALEAAATETPLSEKDLFSLYHE